MDRLAMETLIQLSASHSSTNQEKGYPSETNQHGSSPDNINEERQKKSQ